VLCLNCIHKLDAVPAEVKVKVVVVEDGVEKEITVDITDDLKAVWRKMEERGYSVVAYCAARKVVVVGTPPSPTSAIVECEEFAAA